MHTITFSGLDQIDKAAADFLDYFSNQKQFAFYGEMGVGKTTFIKALCDQLEVDDVVTSPTFAIINEYFTHAGQKVFHFDFYRIKSIEEVYGLGYEDYFYSNDYCFVEWPELVEPLLPEHMKKIKIDVLSNGTRKIRF